MKEKDHDKVFDKLRYHIFTDERFVDFTIYQFGWEACKPKHSFGPTARNHFLFHYIISGKGWLDSDNSSGKTVRYDLHAGQGFLICPDQINSYYADADDPWEYTWIEFDGTRVKEALDYAGMGYNQPVYRPTSKEQSIKLRDAMLHIVDHHDESSFYLTAHGFLFLDQLVKSSATRREPAARRIRDFYIREAMHFIEQNYANPITIEEIAAFCGINRSYFGKVFRETLGKSPQEFIINYRLTKACEMLRFTRMPIKDIAAAVGYPNQLHFSQAFKNYIGVSPRDWRNEHYSGNG